MSAGPSDRGRAARLRRLAEESFDVVIVGGGIVGAGIAWDAATRGLRTALVERGDFASGTSGRTSRLVHGGLRYLKQGRIRLVRTAIRERDLLLRRAPGLVRPLAFTLPVRRGTGTGKASLRIGLWLYDLLSRDKSLPRRAWLPTEGIRGREPRLAPGVLGGGVYYDALTNDARLVLEVLRAAGDAGATLANYAEAVDLLRHDGRAAGVRVRVRESDVPLFDVHASTVVHATGVWLGRPYAAGLVPMRLRPTKGVHLFLPRERVGNREAVVLSAKRDGRAVFVLPWEDLTLVGTTDTDYGGEWDDPRAEADDVDYLLETVNEWFPQAHVGRGDVVSAYAGLRPLIGGRTGARESDISREHEVVESPEGVISVWGGKLTTMRTMAEDVVDRIVGRIGRGGPCVTRERTLGPPPDAQDRYLAQGLPADVAEHLASRRDPASFQAWLAQPGGSERILPNRPYLWAEVDAAVEEEMALTLADVLVRRIGLFHEQADQGAPVCVAVATRIAAHRGWSPARVQEEIRAYHALIARHQHFRGEHGR